MSFPLAPLSQQQVAAPGSFFSPQKINGLVAGADRRNVESRTPTWRTRTHHWCDEQDWNLNGGKRIDSKAEWWTENRAISCGSFDEIDPTRGSSFPSHSRETSSATASNSSSSTKVAERKTISQPWSLFGECKTFQGFDLRHESSLRSVKSLFPQNELIKCMVCRCQVSVNCIDEHSSSCTTSNGKLPSLSTLSILQNQSSLRTKQATTSYPAEPTQVLP